MMLSEAKTKQFDAVETQMQFTSIHKGEGMKNMVQP